MLGLDRISAWWLRGQFNLKERAELYKALILLLNNQVLLATAFERLHHIYSDGGRKRRNIVGIVALECEMGLAEGRPLSVILADWVSFDEVSLIAAGEEAGDLPGAFKRAMQLLDSKKQIKSAVLGAVLYPSLLMIQAVFLLHKISTELVPKLLRNSKDVESLTGPAYLLKVLADAVISYGPVLFGGVVLLLVLIGVSMPVYHGRLRYYLDKIPPWSIYRMMFGSTFLLNTGVLMGSGVQLKEALERMADRARPWLRSRLQDTLYGVNNGMTLGEALQNAGHDFPDKRAVQFLQAISGHDGAEANIEKFGEEWMVEGVAQLQKASKTMLTAAIAMNGGLMLLVLAGASGMSDVATSSMMR